MTTRGVRTWPVALTLVFLSPGVAEMMSGSTPPLLFIQPFALITLPTLYGISILLIHEIMVRRQLGWGNALLMGASFGIFQEALVVQTWFNFLLPKSPSHSMGLYGVLWQTNWDWGLYLTIYHAIISITVPLALIQLFVPRRSRLPWLGKKRIIGLTAWLFLLCGFGAWYLAFKGPEVNGYTHPPLYPYLITVCLTIATFLLGCFLRLPAPQPARTQRPAPGLWKVRFAAFGWIILLFLGINLVLTSTRVPAFLTMLLTVLILSYGLWRVQSWSTRPGWSSRHHLALSTGLLMYFIFIFGPLLEFVSHTPGCIGLTEINLLIFAGLLVFDWRLKKRLASQVMPASAI
jgi:hypothetical protein